MSENFFDEQDPLGQSLYRKAHMLNVRFDLLQLCVIILARNKDSMDLEVQGPTLDLALEKGYVRMRIRNYQKLLNDCLPPADPTLQAKIRTLIGAISEEEMEPAGKELYTKYREVFHQESKDGQVHRYQLLAADGAVKEIRRVARQHRSLTAAVLYWCAEEVQQLSDAVLMHQLEYPDQDILNVLNNKP